MKFIFILMMMFASIAVHADNKWTVVQAQGDALDDPDASFYTIEFSGHYIALSRTPILDSELAAFKALTDNGAKRDYSYGATITSATAPTYDQQLGLLTVIQNMLLAKDPEVSYDAVSRLLKARSGALNELAVIRAKVVLIGK